VEGLPAMLMLMLPDPEFTLPLWQLEQFPSPGAPVYPLGAPPEFVKTVSDKLNKRRNTNRVLKIFIFIATIFSKLRIFEQISK
jgi:hypothetical protein